MRNTNWSTMESVGDQSSYVGELLKTINTGAEETLAIMHKAQYARAFCDNLVEHVAMAYINNVVQCRPVSEVGAEQVGCIPPRMASGQTTHSGLDALGQVRPHQGV